MENRIMLNKGSFFAGPRGPAASSTASSTASSPSSSPAASLVSSSAPPKSTPEPVAMAGENRPAVAAVTEPATTVARLVVGPGVKLKGAEIQDCDTLLVEGRVEATMDSRFIQIADQGSFDGKVTIDVAEIRGRFSGELTAREQIVIHSTGRVSGKIRYGKIVVHEGGELSGDIRSLTAEPAGSEAGDGVATRLAVKTA